MTDIMHYNLQNGPEGVSRRTFIKVLGIALAGSAVLNLGGQAARVVWVPEVLPGSLQRSTFAKYLGGTFHVQPDSSSGIALQLAQVRDLGVAPGNEPKMKTSDPEHSFSVLFRGPGDRPLTQGTFQFRHVQIGSFPLFVVPMAPRDGVQYYEAVFNRLPGA
jgi:hypothetical protein